MVLRLSSDFDQAKRPMSVEGGVGKHFEEVGLADMVRAGTGHENAAKTKHFQGAQVEFFVTTERGVKIALVEEGSRFLAFEGVVAELYAIYGESGGGFLALQGARWAWRKCFEFADTRIYALDDRGWAQAGSQFRKNCLANGIGIHC